MNRILYCMKCLMALQPIVYGMPTKEALDDPNFFSGGCSIVIGENTPQFICPQCRREFDYEGVAIDAESK